MSAKRSATDLPARVSSRRHLAKVTIAALAIGVIAAAGLSGAIAKHGDNDWGDSIFASGGPGGSGIWDDDIASGGSGGSGGWPIFGSGGSGGADWDDDIFDDDWFDD